jgi:PAS domain S-box-containing protein
MPTHSHSRFLLENVPLLDSPQASEQLNKFCRSVARFSGASETILFSYEQGSVIAAWGNPKKMTLEEIRDYLKLLQKKTSIRPSKHSRPVVRTLNSGTLSMMTVRTGPRPVGVLLLRSTRKIPSSKLSTIGELLRFLGRSWPTAPAIDLPSDVARQDWYQIFVDSQIQGIYRVSIDPPIDTRQSPHRQTALYFERAVIVDCNRAMLEMYGLASKNDLVGRKVGDILIPSDPHNIAVMMQFIKNGYRTFDQESHEVDPAGRARVFVNSAVGILHDGQLHGLWGTQHDVTLQKAAMQELRASEQRYRQLVESFWEAIFITDYSGRMLYTNAAVRRLTGYSVDTYGSESFANVHPEDRQRVVRFVEDFVKSPNDYSGTIENRFIDNRGRVRFHSSVISKVTYDDQPGLQFIVRDVTEQKKAEMELRESRSNLLAIIENTPDSIWSVDRECNLVVANSALLKSFEGATGIRLRPGMNILENLPDDLRPVWAERYARVLSGETFVIEEIYDLGTLQGQFEIAFFPISTSDGVWGAGVFSRDVTAKRTAQQALEKSERYFRALIENALDIITILDATGKIVYESPAVEKIFGYKPEELVGRNIFEFNHPDEAATLRRIFERAVRREIKVVDMRFRFRHKNGHWRRLEVTGHNMLDDPIVHGIVVNSRDVTEREEAERALRYSEKRYRNLVETMYEFVAELDMEGRFMFVNESFARFTAYERKELIGQNFYTFVHPDDAHAVQTCCRTLESTGKPVRNFECRFRNKDGTYRYFLINADLMTADPDERRSILQVCFDMTERKVAEQNLAAEKEQLAVTLRSIGDGVITADIEGRVVLINREAERLLGWTQEESVGRPSSDIFKIVHQKTREAMPDPIQRVITTGAIVELSRQTSLIAKDGTERLITDSAAPIRDAESRIIGAVLVFRDITEKQKMEEERVKAMKLESVGILAGGIAHDFNNILTAILGNISLARVESHGLGSSSLSDMLVRSEKACLRARDLTQQLLTFSRGGVPVRQVASIRELIRESVEFVTRGSKVRCEFSLDDRLWSVDVDRGQINQVIHNLALNAMQAMPDGGVLFVDARNENLEQNNDSGLRPGHYVKLTFRDQGIGITPDVLPKIFDPYFTTKPTGSGLGLAMCYSIVKSHDGYITLDSEPGHGTSFYVYLPASDQQALGVSEENTSWTAVEGRVLIMDDEPEIRSLLVRIMQGLGFRAEAVASGDAAVQTFRDALAVSDPFTLVIMDLTVPGAMGGRDAIHHLRELDPNVKAIVASGYFNDPIMADYKKFGFSGVIAKPFNLDEIRRLVQRITTGS